jgi:hypothetical protein
MCWTWCVVMGVAGLGKEGRGWDEGMGIFREEVSIVWTRCSEMCMGWGERCADSMWLRLGVRSRFEWWGLEHRVNLRRPFYVSALCLISLGWLRSI